MSVIVIGLSAVYLVYLALLIRWWPVLDNPEYFTRREQDERDHIAWAASLVEIDKEWRL